MTAAPNQPLTKAAMLRSRPERPREVHTSTNNPPAAASAGNHRICANQTRRTALASAEAGWVRKMDSTVANQ